MDISLRTRPKGYNKKAWIILYEEAENEKKWALETLKNQQWLSIASTSSIEYLGKCLYLKPWELAKENYDYLFMRATGQTFLGPLDATARDKWIVITGKKINKNKFWKYDHTKNITSATYKNGRWYDFTGKVVELIK